MSCPGKGQREHAELKREAEDIAAALGHALEGKPLRFALVIWDGSGLAMLASNAHQVTVRHQLAKVLSAELEGDFKRLAESVQRTESGVH